MKKFIPLSTDLRHHHTYLSDVRPLPKASPRKKKQQQRRKGKSQVSTLTPVRNEIAEKERAKLKKKRSNTAKKELFKKKKRSKK